MNGDAIIAAARDGGALAMERWREGQQPDCKVWEKKPGHPVCDIDLAVDDLLKERLCAILPEAGWLSEETEDNSDRIRRDWTWLVDPVDGTRDFIRGRNAVGLGHHRQVPIGLGQPNSIALRICMVASNAADLVATLRWGNEWDVAAANLIAAEAGATVSDALGDPIRYNKASPKDFGLIVCAPGIHGAVVERLAPKAAEILAGD